MPTPPETRRAAGQEMIFSLAHFCSSKKKKKNAVSRVQSRLSRDQCRCRRRRCEALFVAESEDACSQQPEDGTELFIEESSKAGIVVIVIVVVVFFSCPSPPRRRALLSRAV